MKVKKIDVCVFTVLVSFVVACQGQYEDTRCKCVCPDMANNTLKQTSVIKKGITASECKCDNVVLPKHPDKPELCLQCECRYESRNTTTIKVVVIFIICVVALLFVYMLFMLGLDPFLVQRRNKYHEQMNEEVNLDDHTVTQVPIEPSTSGRSIDPQTSRQRSIINRVTDEQKKWKGVVQAQRQSVYDSHTMLN